MQNQLEQLAAKAIDLAKKNGADAADVLAFEQDATSIEVNDGQLEHAERAESLDLGLRVIVDGKQASISGSDLSDDGLAEMASRAITMAKLAPVDPYAGLADFDQLAQETSADALELLDPNDPPSASDLEVHAKELEAAALANSGISQVQSAAASASRSRFHLMTSNGFSAGYARSGYSRSVVAIAGEGLAMERDYAGESASHFANLPECQEIGELAAARSVERLNPIRPKTGSYPILFDERIAASLIGHLLGAINGGNIVRGSSWLLDSIGDQILPKGIDLIEQPHRARISGSRPFDGEGLPTRTRHILRNGILEGYTLDLSTARQLNMTSTANASRGLSNAPSPSSGNMALTQGDKSRDELIKEMGTGLLVTSMIGSTINPNTGDYSRGAAGFWIENGEITSAANQCTIAGNLRDMLASIIPANDAREDRSRLVPSLLVEGMTLAGS